MKGLRQFALGLLCGIVIPVLSAEPLPSYYLILEDHLFFPSRLEVPAYTKFKLVIKNRDDTAEEFDSFDLNREKVIFPKRSSQLYVGPLEPGNYEFFGEFNSSTARGVIVAVEGKPATGTGEASMQEVDDAN